MSSKTHLDASPVDCILQELEKVGDHFDEVKKATKKIESSGEKAVPCEPEGEKWKIIGEKIQQLEREIEIMKATMQEQEKRHSEVVDALMEQRSDNVKLKAEIVSVQISLETERQRRKKGALIICGLPLKATVNAEQVYTNICKKLKIESAAVSAPTPTFRVTKVENKSVGEQRLEICNLGEEQSSLIMQKYREARRSKVFLTSGDLMKEGDTKPVYINESLTGYFQLLFKIARDMRRNDLLKFAWTKSGVLYARKSEKSKIFQIKHRKDLEKFK
ncbi:uncharacterized protein LOC129789208 [Lutzomyia longipalpis]|uniref:uncharacterized protein LOC129789208 n=1 Tax=Lutzomyia longipalpis TaxID=7200 RepID=UPI002483D680|nr:uncharacterized protein LOC129789208 [Lutzomyia longipalpis]